MGIIKIELGENDMDINLVNYDYFEDVNYGYQSSSFNLNNRADPDGASVKLYSSLFRLFFEDNDEKVLKKDEHVLIKGQKILKNPLFYSFFIENNKANSVDIILSSDYIGPSINQAMYLGELTTNEIKSIIQISRTLGGHIFWPRGKGVTPTINQVKGGEISSKCGYGFYDRIDWTFLLLKIYYSVQDNEKNSISIIVEKVKEITKNDDISNNDIECFKAMMVAFNRSDSWLNRFTSFDKFCEFFKLKGSFVNSNCEVIELTQFFPIKPDKDGYRRYIENNLLAIIKRNFKLLD